MFIDTPQAKTWALYELIKYWMPWIGGGWLVLKAGYWIKDQIDTVQQGVTEWGHKLLNNHLSHIETATARTVTLLEEVRDNQLSLSAREEEVAKHVKQVVEDLKLHEKEDQDLQGKILTGIDILKDRTKV